MQQRKVRTGAGTGAAKLEQLEPRQLLSTTLDGDVLRILDDAGANVIQLSKSSTGSLVVQENGDTYQFDSSLIHKIWISTGAGNDRVLATGVDIPLEAYLGAGNDTLVSGAGADVIFSGKGNDLISAGDGNNVVTTDTGTDRVITGAGNDVVWSGSRTDLINTGKGHDTVSGKSKTVNTGKASVYSPMLADVSYKPGVFQETVTGYDPNQIRNAYGFGDSDPNAGAGQTIYIVDAFTGLDVVGDFTTFCNQFDLPVPTADNFKIVNVNGKTPAIDSGWAMEIMLDLEWARAIAPAANIVLVQADSNIDTDMYLAVKKAANMAQKVGGVVSMSFGRDFVYDPGVAGYSPVTTTAMDLMEKLFHSRTKVTFVAASGDSGNLAVASYPAMSPNVTAVGGTVLTLDQDGNQIAEESAWINGGSGYAPPDWFERPGYQKGIAYFPPDPNFTPTMTVIPPDDDVRAIPDVSYNATNFAVYTTTPTGGDAGWFAVGGTSAGTPQWAAIVALANQKRAAVGRAPIGNGLNGIAYDIYNGFADVENPGQNQGYGDNFNDIFFGQAGPWFAVIGYDMATGVGSPKAEHLIDTLADYTGFFLQSNFSFNGHLFMPASVSRFGLFPVASGQTHTGTGSILGTDTVALQFLTDPVPMYGPNFTPVIVPDRYYDVEEGQQSAFRVQLYRAGRGQTSGRIYGKGTADIFNADPRIVTIPPGTPMTFTLNFEGRWWTGKDGQIHFKINFGAINPVNYQPLESAPAELVYDPTLPWLGAYFEGSISG